MRNSQYVWDSDAKRLVLNEEYKSSERFNCEVKHVWSKELGCLVRKVQADGAVTHVAAEKATPIEKSAIVARKIEEIVSRAKASKPKYSRYQREGLPHCRLTDDHWCREGAHLISNEVWHMQQAAKDRNGKRPFECKYNL
jgi:hypothetical protein